jgi:hypothetical protein
MKIMLSYDLPGATSYLFTSTLNNIFALGHNMDDIMGGLE